MGRVWLGELGTVSWRQVVLLCEVETFALPTLLQKFKAPRQEEVEKEKVETKLQLAKLYRTHDPLISARHLMVSFCVAFVFGHFIFDSAAGVAMWVGPHSSPH